MRSSQQRDSIDGCNDTNEGRRYQRFVKNAPRWSMASRTERARATTALNGVQQPTAAAADGGGGSSDDAAATGFGSCFLASLAWQVDEQMVRDAFKQCGDVKAVRFATDRQSGDFQV